MANSTAGVPFSVPVGAALLGLANLFAQQPQAAAIGYTIYAIAEAGPFMFPDYNTTAAKIKNLTSNFHIADYSSVLSDLFQASNELLAETPTVLVTENSAIPLTQAPSTPEDIVSVDSVPHGTSVETEPETFATEATAQSDECIDNDEPVDSLNHDFIYQVPTTSSATAIETEQAVLEIAHDQDLPEKSDTPVFDEVIVDMTTSSNIRSFFARMTNKVPTVPSVPTATTDTDLHTSSPPLILTVEPSSNIDLPLSSDEVDTLSLRSSVTTEPLPPVDVLLPSDDAHAIQGATFDEAGLSLSFSESLINTWLLDSIVVLPVWLWLGYVYLIRGHESRWRYSKASVGVYYGIVVAGIAYYGGPWKELSALCQLAQTWTTFSILQLGTSFQVHSDTIIVQLPWVKSVAYAVVLAVEILCVVGSIPNFGEVDLVAAIAYVYLLWLLTIILRPLPLGIVIIWSVPMGFLYWAFTTLYTYPLLLSIRVSQWLDPLLVLVYDWSMPIMAPFFRGAILCLIDGSFRPLNTTLMTQLIMIALCWTHNYRWKCIELAQQTTRTCRRKAAAGVQMTKTFIYEARWWLVFYFFLAASITLLNKYGAHLVTTFQPYLHSQPWGQLSRVILGVLFFLLMSYLAYANRERCTEVAQRITRATKRTAAAGRRMMKDFIYSYQRELLVISIGASMIILRKYGPSLVTTFGPYFTLEMLGGVYCQIKSMATSTIAWESEGWSGVISLAKSVYAWYSEFWACVNSWFKAVSIGVLASYSEEWNSVKFWTRAFAAYSKSKYVDRSASLSIHLGRLLNSCKDTVVEAIQSTTTFAAKKTGDMGTRATEMGTWATGYYIPAFVSTACRPRWIWLAQGDKPVLLAATLVAFFFFCIRASYLWRSMVALLWVFGFGLPGMCTERFWNFFPTVAMACFLACLFLINWENVWETLCAWTTYARRRIPDMRNGFCIALRTCWREIRRASRTCMAFIRDVTLDAAYLCWRVVRAAVVYSGLLLLYMWPICWEWLIYGMAFAWETLKGSWQFSVRKFRGVLGIDWALFMKKLGQALCIVPYPVDQPEEPVPPTNPLEQEQARREVEEETTRRHEENIGLRMQQERRELARQVEARKREEEIEKLRADKEFLQIQNKLLKREEQERERKKEKEETDKRLKEEQRKREEEENAERDGNRDPHADQLEAQRAELENQMAAERRDAATAERLAAQRIAAAEQASAQLAEKLAATLAEEAALAANNGRTDDTVQVTSEGNGVPAPPVDPGASAPSRSTFGRTGDLNADEFPLPDLYNRPRGSWPETGVNSKAAWQDRFLGGESVLMKIKRRDEAGQDDSSSGPPAPPATAQDDSSNTLPPPPPAAQDTDDQAPQTYSCEMEGVQYKLPSLEDIDGDITMDNVALTDNDVEMGDTSTQAPALAQQSAPIQPPLVEPHPDGSTNRSRVRVSLPGFSPVAAGQLILGQAAAVQPFRVQDPQTQVSQVQAPQDPQTEDTQTQAPRTQAPEVNLSEEILSASDIDDEDYYNNDSTAQAQDPIQAQVLAPAPAAALSQTTSSAPDKLPPVTDTPATKQVPELEKPIVDYESNDEEYETVYDSKSLEPFPPRPSPRRSRSASIESDDNVIEALVSAKKADNPTEYDPMRPAAGFAPAAPAATKPAVTRISLADYSAKKSAATTPVVARSAMNLPAPKFDSPVSKPSGREPVQDNYSSADEGDTFDPPVVRKPDQAPQNSAQSPPKPAQPLPKPTEPPIKPGQSPTKARISLKPTAKPATKPPPQSLFASTLALAKQGGSDLPRVPQPAPKSAPNEFSVIDPPTGSNTPNWGTPVLRPQPTGPRPQSPVIRPQPPKAVGTPAAAKSTPPPNQTVKSSEFVTESGDESGLSDHDDRIIEVGEKERAEEEKKRKKWDKVTIRYDA
jgi:hypothetical protein